MESMIEYEQVKTWKNINMIQMVCACCFCTYKQEKCLDFSRCKEGLRDVNGNIEKLKKSEKR